MRAEIRIDGERAVTLHPLDPGWAQGRGIEVHEGATRLSCRLDGRSGAARVLPWIEHLLPENGHRERSKERARRRLRAQGLSPTVLNTGHELWANAAKEYPGKTEVVAFDRNGEEVKPGKGGYVDLTDREVGWLVGLAGRIADGGKAADEYRTKLREHGLSGGRGKVCLRWDWERSRWTMPTGSSLSSHILKNESAREWLPAEGATESYCQRALGLAGIEAAWTRCRVYEGISTVVSWRSDRANVPRNVPLEPIHQEEWSQAIGLYPEEKKAEGGPEQGWAGLLRLLRRHGQDPECEEHKLVKAIAAIVMMGNGDTHRRNVGLQHVWGQEGRKVVLAPLYDCSSIEGVAWGPVKAMELPIGGEYEFDQVDGRHWRALAESAGTRIEGVMDAVRETAEKLPEGLAKAARIVLDENEVRNEGALKHRIDRIRSACEKRGRKILAEIGTRAEHAQARQAQAARRAQARPMPKTPTNLMER